jgi:hypothetical protein
MYLGYFGGFYCPVGSVNSFPDSRKRVAQWGPSGRLNISQLKITVSNTIQHVYKWNSFPRTSFFAYLAI